MEYTKSKNLLIVWFICDSSEISKCFYTDHDYRSLNTFEIHFSWWLRQFCLLITRFRSDNFFVIQHGWPRSFTSISDKITGTLGFSKPANWTAGKLKSELEKMNITLSISLGKNMLKRIYLENVTRRHSVSELRPNMSDASNEQIEPVLQELNESHSNNDFMEASNVVQAESEIPSAIVSTNNNSPGSDTVTHEYRKQYGRQNNYR